jgi:1,4-alpha-glucan branching enzyme
MNKTLNLIDRDPWLEPYKKAIVGRYEYALNKESELTENGKSNLSDFATGYLYFGLHRTNDGWVFREWAPNATQIYMIGTFSDWKEKETYAMKRIDNGNWELELPADALQHGELYKLNIHWNDGQR